MSQEYGLTHVRLLVDAYADCFRFYRDTLGFEATFGDETSGYADFDADGVALALFDADEMLDALPGDDERDRTVRGRDDAALVLRVDDLDAAYETAVDGGGNAVAPPTDHVEWGIRTAHVRDPDGTLLELNRPLS
ncbi:VOC family protein [Haloarchaeobius baliensis]|uniref:VOC family protein n=1 Tax=Haloarchaeobius baliensis TaxID=1670458 RepID=UPI003F8831AC